VKSDPTLRIFSSDFVISHSALSEARRNQSAWRLSFPFVLPVHSGELSDGLPFQKDNPGRNDGLWN
jgi:hypothetical protein